MEAFYGYYNRYGYFGLFNTRSAFCSPFGLSGNEILGGQRFDEKNLPFYPHGANAFLKRQYKIVLIFFSIMLAILGVMAIFGLLNPFTPFAFISGGFFSALSGFIGMKIATASNARTANA